MAGYGLVPNLLQRNLTYQYVLFRALRPGIEQRPLHMALNLAKLLQQPAAQLGLCVIADQPCRRNGSLDLMNPALNIFPVLPLGCLGI